MVAGLRLDSFCQALLWFESSALLRRHRRGRDAARDVPDEAGELTRDGHHDLVGGQASRGEPAVPLAQAQLRTPSDVGDGLGKLGLASGDDRADAGRVSVVVRHLHQHAPRSAVAGLGDRTLALAGAAGVFAGHQAEVGHELARVGEAVEVLDLGGDGHGRDKLDTAHGLQSRDDGGQGPGLRRVAQTCLQPCDARGGLADRVQILPEGDLLGGVRQANIGQPTQVDSKGNWRFVIKGAYCGQSNILDTPSSQYA